MRLYLDLQQCPVRLIWIIFVIGGRWPYRFCLVGCCIQDFLDIARSILVQLTSSFFFWTLCQRPCGESYSSMDTTAAWKILRFILSDRADFNMTDNLSMPVDTFACHEVVSFSVDETLLLRLVTRTRTRIAESTCYTVNSYQMSAFESNPKVKRLGPHICFRIKTGFPWSTRISHKLTWHLLTSLSVHQYHARGVVVIVVGNGQILDETDCISHSTNTLGEGMNPIILPPVMGK